MVTCGGRELTSEDSFYNLAAMPEIVPELREEIRDVLAESGGVFSSSALQKMKKMDSFLRETSRHHPPGFGEFLAIPQPPQPSPQPPCFSPTYR